MVLQLTTPSGGDRLFVFHRAAFVFGADCAESRNHERRRRKVGGESLPPSLLCLVAVASSRPGGTKRRQETAEGGFDTERPERRLTLQLLCYNVVVFDYNDHAVVVLS